MRIIGEFSPCLEEGFDRGNDERTDNNGTGTNRECKIDKDLNAAVFGGCPREVVAGR